MMDYLRGSLWRKWDLHIHTKSSYDYKMEKNTSYTDEGLVEQWKNLGFAAVAVTDHFKIDEERIKNLSKLAKKEGITVFPGVELRTDKGASNVHIIAIFSEKLDIKELSNYFKYNTYMKAENAKSNETIYWKLEDIQEFVNKFEGLLTVHAGNKASGIDKQMNNDAFYRAIKEQYASIIDAFEVNNLKSYDDYQKKVVPHLRKAIKKEIPVIVSSDNHNYHNYELSTNLWIKADPTFKGLKQAFLHAEERIFVGEKPEKVIHHENNPKRIMEKLSIRKVETAKNSNTWFESDLELNPALTAIIGNKGSGKSAISDILGLANYSSRLDNLAFLRTDRFNKVPHKYGEDYEATLHWCDGEVQSLDNLYVDSDLSFSKSATAQYLPQTYIEKICGDIENKAFQEEINKVIFSYIPPESRLEAKNFEEFISFKTTPLKTQLKALFKDIEKINSSIIKLESQHTNKYLEEINQEITRLQSDFDRQEKSKPNEVKEPTDEESQVISKEINVVKKKIDDISESIIERKEKSLKLSKAIQELINLQSEIKNMQISISQLNSKIEEKITSFTELDPEQVKIIYLFKEETLADELVRLNLLMDGVKEQLNAPQGLIVQKEILSKELDNLITRSTQKSQEYHLYKRSLKEWEESLRAIKGDDKTEGTLNYFKKIKHYVEKDLDSDYLALIRNRKEKINEIYNIKVEIQSMYERVYAPIDQELAKNLGEIKENVQFKTRLLFDDSIILDSLRNINKRPKSLFQGVQESNQTLTKEIRETDINNFESFYSFIEKVLSCGLGEEFDQIEKVINNKADFYNEISCLQYIDVDYQLSFDGNELSELSPGERGLVLLVFYLALSKDEMPIIIDQPEDNLDNQSVYSRLVPCIRKAKKRRQVIIVTHNPNIAIACDAEQIVVADIDKSNNSIRYSTGSIENEQINERVVEILEGTQPAFKLRGSKYQSLI